MNPDSTLSSTHNCPNDGVHLCSVHLTGPIPRCLISPVVGLGLSPIGNGTNDIVRKDCRSPSVTIIGDTSLVPLEISRSVSSVAGTTVPLKERPSDSKSSTLATGLPISSPPSKITGFFAKSSAEVGIGRLNRNGNVFMPCANRPVLREMPKVAATLPIGPKWSSFGRYLQVCRAAWLSPAVSSYSTITSTASSASPETTSS